MSIFYQKTSAAGGVATNANLTRFFDTGNAQLAVNTTETPSKLTFRNAGTLSLLGIRVSTNTLTGNAVLTLRKNGANGNQVITIAAGLTGYFEDTVNTDSISAADTVGYQLVTGTGTSITIHAISTSFTATTGTITHYSSNGGLNFTGTSATTFSPIAGQIRSVTTGADTQVKSKESFTLRDLYVYVNTNTRTSTTTVHSRKNTANGAISVSIPLATTGVFEDTTNSDSLVSGDLYNSSITLGLGVGGINLEKIVFEGSIAGADQLQYVTGNSTISQNSALTRFIEIQGGLGLSSVENIVSDKTSLNIVFSNMAVWVSANTLNGSTVMNFRKNKHNGLSTITIPTATTGYFEDTVNQDIIIGTDTINYQTVTAGSSGTISFTTMAILANTYTPNHLLPILGCGQ